MLLIELPWQDNCREQGLSFIDLTKVFDSLSREAQRACRAGMPCGHAARGLDVSLSVSTLPGTTRMDERMCNNNDGEQSGSFNINTGVKLGCVVTPKSL